MPTFAWTRLSLVDRLGSSGQWLYLSLIGAATLSIWVKATWVVLVLESAILAGAASWIALSGPPRRRTTLPLPAIGLAGVAGLGLFQLVLDHSSNPYSTLVATLFWLALGAGSVLCQLAVLPPRAGSFLDACSTFAGVVTILALLQFFTSGGAFFWLWPSGEPNVFGPFQSRNNFASFVLLFLPSHMSRALAGGRGSSALFAAVSFAAIVCSGSRAGTALALLEVAVVAICWRWHPIEARHRTAAFRLALVMFLALAVAGWETLALKISDRDPMRYRREIMQSAVQMTLQRPLLGHGLGSFPTVYPSAAQFDSGHFVNHSHNDWLEWASEAGLPCALALVLSTLAAVWTLRRTPWAVGLAAVALHALVDYPLQRFGLAVWVVTITTVAALQSSRSDVGPNQGSPAL